MALGFLLGAGLSLLGARESAKGAEKAAETAAGASDRSAEIIEKQFQTTKEALDPYIAGGPAAFEQQQALSGALGADAQRQAYADYVESPGVAFAREQGLRGINQQASAMGGLGGGNRLKRLTEYSQGLALQDFNNYFNRLGTVTGTGLTAAQALGGVSGQAAAGQAQMTQLAGSQRAEGQTAAQQAYASGLSNIYGAAAQTPWGQKVGLPTF